jgi:hypothetical protein
LNPATSWLLRLGGVGLLVHEGILAESNVRSPNWNRQCGNARLDSANSTPNDFKRPR